MQRAGMASPRLGGDSPSKRGGPGGGLWGFPGGVGGGKAKIDAGSRTTNLLVILSVLLNVTVVGILLFRCGAPSSSPYDPSAAGGVIPDAHTATMLATTSASNELLTLQLAALQDTLSTVRAEKADALSGEKAALARAAQALDERAALAKSVEELQAAAAAVTVQATSGSAAAAAGECACKQQSRLSPDDLALQGTKFDLTSHEFEWKCDEEVGLTPHTHTTRTHVVKHRA